MTFRPSLHGWPFGNELAVAAPELGLGAPPGEDLGVGGGMCWAALDRYLAGVRMPADAAAPEPGSPLHAELVRRNAAALSGVWTRAAGWQAAPDGSWRDRLPARVPLTGEDLGARSRAEWRSLRRRLESGEPVLLTLLGEADPYSRRGAVWQVLATGAARDGRTVTLDLYDPSHPMDDERRLVFELSGPLDGRLTGGRKVRGFFAVPYDRHAPPALRPQTFADRAVIGLNRKVRGQVSAVAAGERLDLVARDADGALIHFRRARGRHWEGVNVSDREGWSGHELHSDPQAVAALGMLHVFTRSYAGDLLHFRLLRRWRFSNRTDHKRAGPRFRIEGAPVPAAGPRGRLSVLGRDRDGGLVHYAYAPFRGWFAEQVAGDPLATEPVAFWNGDTLHVIAVARDRRVLTWTRSDDRWTALDLTAVIEAGPVPRIAGRPVAILDRGGLHVFGREEDGGLAHFCRGPDGRWTAQRLADGIEEDPVVTGGPAGLHVFARTADGDVLHAWRSDRWRHERLLATRPTLSADHVPATEIRAWGTGSELWVCGRGAAGVMLLRWRQDADWSAAPLRHHAGAEEKHEPVDEPVLIGDGTGRPHLVATDGRGTVVHLETGAWSEPAERAQATAARPRAVATAAAAAKAATVKAAAAPEPVEMPAEEEAPEPAELPEKVAAGGTEASRADDFEAFDLPDLASPPPPPSPPATPPSPPGAGSSETGRPSPASDLPMLDFETDTRDDLLAELPELPAPTPRPDAAAGRGGKPGAKKESEASSGSAEDEPMDLSLLDSWPPPPRSLRKERPRPAPRAEKEAS